MRPLPPPETWDETLRVQKIMARPLVGGLAKFCEMVDVRPLDDAEKESLEVAFAALLYERASEFNALSLLYMTLAGVGAPRAAEYMEKRRAGKLKLAKGATEISETTVDAVRTENTPAFKVG